MDRPSHRLALDQILHLETHDQTIQQLVLNGAKSRAIPEACNINAKKHMSTNLQSLAYSLSGHCLSQNVISQDPEGKANNLTKIHKHPTKRFFKERKYASM